MEEILKNASVLADASVSEHESIVSNEDHAMLDKQLSQRQPAGIDLFLGIEGLAQVLNEENELLITGGRRRNSTPPRRNTRRVVRRRRTTRRVVRRRNIFTT